MRCLPGHCLPACLPFTLRFSGSIFSPQDYEAFWESFGRYVKLGCIEDAVSRSSGRVCLLRCMLCLPLLRRAGRTHACDTCATSPACRRWLASGIDCVCAGQPRCAKSPLPLPWPPQCPLQCPLPCWLLADQRTALKRCVLLPSNPPTGQPQVPGPAAALHLLRLQGALLPELKLRSRSNTPGATCLGVSMGLGGTDLDPFALQGALAAWLAL